MMPREPEEEITNQEVEVSEEDTSESVQTLAEEKQKAEKYLANWQRTQADFINYKQRTEQEKGEISKLAKSALILSLLPVLDDLERAIASIPPKLSQHTWVDGIRLIERKFRASLETQGLSTIEAVGEQFDPHLHEAIRQDKGEEGKVIAEMEKGYTFYDRVIRPSKVVVGDGEVEEETETEQEDNNWEDTAPA